MKKQRQVVANIEVIEDVAEFSTKEPVYVLATTELVLYITSVYVNIVYITLIVETSVVHVCLQESTTVVP